VIAVLFAFYDIVLTIMGIVAGGPADTAKAGGIDLNRWTGIAMIIISVLFIVWARMKPLYAEQPPPDADDRPPMHH
jgi:hypothetical protein